MKPGSKLNALVAEKVMGCKVQTQPLVEYYREDGVEKKRDATGYHCGCPQKNGFAPHGHTYKDGRWTNGGFPEYSSSIAAAWTVFHAISNFRSGFPPIGDMKHPARDGRSAFYKPVIQLKYYEHDGEVEVRIGRCKGVDHDDDVVVNLDCAEDKIPYAICLAALKAVGVGVS